MTPEEEEKGYAVALEEARRGFDLLVAETDVVRNRAVSTLGMGGLAASFLGGLAIRDGADVSRWTWAAVVAFVVLAGLCVVILLPRRLFVSQRPGELVAWVATDGQSPAQMNREVALWMGKKYDKNRPKIDKLHWIYAGASVAFLVEILALVLDLMSR